MKSLVRIRPPVPEDWQFYIDGVREILAQQGNTFTEEDLEEERAIFAKLSTEQRFLVAESGEGAVSGYLLYERGSCKPWLPAGVPTQPFVWVNVVYVSALARGRGVGRLLYDHLEALVRKEGCRRVMLDAYEVNVGSIAFHERLRCETVCFVDKWHLKDDGGNVAAVKSVEVSCPGPGLLVAALGEWTTAGRLRFQYTRDCPYGVSYGKKQKC
jgi:GNAT superfamily N-acetyltransferase